MCNDEVMYKKNVSQLCLSVPTHTRTHPTHTHTHTLTHPTVPRLAVVKEMIRRLQDLRHTDQVQRAYALNCGEGATVSYELQIRVLREFGLPDAAAELLQVRAFPSCTPSPSTLLWRHTANTTPSDTPLCPCDRR